MLQLLKVNAFGVVDISNTIDKIVWKGQKYRAPRSIDITFVDTAKGYHARANAKEGEGLTFLWNGVELFRGIIFNQAHSKKAKATLTAHDNLFYFVSNKDTYVFDDKTASEITTRICSDFQIPIGTIADTGYKIPHHPKRDKLLYDIIMAAINTTYKQTGVRYYLRSLGGKLELIKRVEQVKKWVIENGVNLIDYDYQTSIEKTATRVKMITGEGKETIIATAENSELMNAFGVLQYYERVHDEINQAQLQQRTDTALKENGKTGETIKVTALGLPDVISGSAIHLIIPEHGIERGYYIDADKHTFKGNSHTMKLTLTQTNELPGVV